MRCLCLFVTACAAAAAGCNSEPYKVARVSGRVTLDDKPLPNVSVMFSPIPVAGNINPGPDSGARTDADGRFTLILSGKDTEGAVVGKHKVRITYVVDSDTHDDTLKRVFKKLPAKYSGKDTVLEFDVPAGGTTEANFPLQSK